MRNTQVIYERVILVIMPSLSGGIIPRPAYFLFADYFWRLNTRSRQRPSSSMMGCSPIAKKSPIDQMGKNICGKLMVSFPIRSIYLDGTNYHNLLLHYGENL